MERDRETEERKRGDSLKLLEDKEKKREKMENKERNSR